MCGQNKTVSGLLCGQHRVRIPSSGSGSFTPGLRGPPFTHTHRHTPPPRPLLLPSTLQHKQSRYGAASRFHTIAAGSLFKIKARLGARLGTMSALISLRHPFYKSIIKQQKKIFFFKKKEEKRGGLCISSCIAFIETQLIRQEKTSSFRFMLWGNS